MSLKERVSAVIEKVRPTLEADGGGIELVDVLEDEKVVLVNLTGACHGCPMSTMTIKGFVEQTIIEEIPEIKEVKLAH
ncbi:MAG TPA: NifU family protein [Candidatus Deferrimicrobium sp.]|nr:NifU family protein [Candidatus Kapabacteria bacterium]HLP58915.1 NifU family protein [Candidatus Deferrimicrobium sp.]